MQLAKALTNYGRVAYDSLEEGTALTMINTLRRYEMDKAGSRFQLLDCEPMDELGARIKKHKSPDFYIIDSFQYTQMTYKDYIRLKEEFPDKLFIFISHARGKNPKGDAATSVMYDADLKIWVEGYVAYSKGRYRGDTGQYTIWELGASEAGLIK